jgi:5'-nucleotidase
LRASIDAGEVTMGEVLTVLPFQNTLATFQLKGTGVIAALENGVSQIADGAGRFPQVSGLKFSFDAATEPGSRISDVMVADASGNFMAIDPQATYGVVSNNFMRGGGDGYSVFKTDGMDAYDYGPGLEQVVADYLAAKSPYKPYTDGRIQAAAMTAPAASEPAPAAAPEEVTVDVPQTGLGAGALATEPPKVVPEAKPEMATSAGGAMEAKTHIVVRGDNYWNLAKEYYGNPTMWKKIDEANPGNRARRLEIGAELAIPN